MSELRETEDRARPEGGCIAPALGGGSGAIRIASDPGEVTLKSGHDLALERAILEFLNDWKHDLDGPGGSAVIVYPDTLADFPILPSKTDAQAQRSWRKFENHLRTARERGYVEGKEWKNGWGKQQLTSSGHMRLEWLQEQTFWRKLRRLVWNIFNKATASILTPIVVAILTVFVLQWLGLNDSANATLGDPKVPTEFAPQGDR